MGVTLQENPPGSPEEEEVGAAYGQGFVLRSNYVIAAKMIHTQSRCDLSARSDGTPQRVHQPFSGDVQLFPPVEASPPSLPQHIPAGNE